jgi:hypothetical protein
LVSRKHCLDLAVSLEESNVLVEDIQNLNEVFICALLVSFISLLETHDYQVVIAELSDELI